jgi:signal transduction histidine kinase
VAQKFGNVNRAGASRVLGKRIPKAPHLPRGGFGLRALAEPWAWRDPAHALLGFPLAVAFFPFALGWTVGGLGGLLYPLWAWALPDDNIGLPSQLLGLSVPVLDAAFVVVAGALVVWSTPFVVRGLAWIDARIAAWMLHDENAALRQRTKELTSSRSAAAEAEAAALTRLEHDLHDGPQQRLLRLGMDLDLAQRRIQTDPEGAQALVGQATMQVRETLAELRMLSRGVAPPELSERGLPTALTALASRSTVPTTLDVRLPPGRLPPIVERTAYFVVAECLANVGKHSGATACRIEVSSGSGRLQVIVMDDGVGGANLGLGHGLAGLVDRLHGVDGTLEIDSPIGGPTWIRAQLPDA